MKKINAKVYKAIEIKKINTSVVTTGMPCGTFLAMVSYYRTRGRNGETGL